MRTEQKQHIEMLQRMIPENTKLPRIIILKFCSDVWSEKNEGENKKRLCYKEDGKSTEELVYN